MAFQPGHPTCATDDPTKGNCFDGSSPGKTRLSGKTAVDKEEPSWNMMGDKFQLGPFTDVIDGTTQRVTAVTNFF